MKTLKTLLLISIFSPVLSQNKDSLTLRKIYDYYLSDSKCYKNLEVLCTTIGPRLSGSPQAEKSVEWAKQAMYDAGADTVILQPCRVTHWERGAKETCVATWPGKRLNLAVCALGGSTATPVSGINGPVIEVKDYKELKALGEQNQLKGKIVFYNVAFNCKNISTGQSYGETVEYRYTGAAKASKYGAVATLVRSMSSCNNDLPHTGSMTYDSATVKIPAFALSFKAADDLAKAMKEDPKLMVSLKSFCKIFPDTTSYNVIGEIRGSEKPNEYIVVSGHLDSWDLGQGAHDDGAGIVQSIEALAMFKKTKLKPKHTIRAIAFMNEENGLGGAKAYGKETEKKKWKHIAAIESDAGGFTPRGFGVDTTAGMYKLAATWKPLFEPYYINRIHPGGGGADISPLEKLGVPCIGFEPDGQRYFDLHHTADDTFDKVHKRELELSAAAIGSLIYLIDKYK